MKFSRSSRSQSVVVLAGVAALALALATSTAAQAAPPNPNTPTPVAGGVSATALPHATAFATTAASTAETVSFVMRIRNESQLETAVTHGIRSFQTVKQFTAQYGADPSIIAQLTGYLGTFGITTKVDPDNLDVIAKGTADDFDSALSVTQKDYHVAGVKSSNGRASVPAQTIHSATQAPKLPSAVAKAVLAVLGLSNYSPFSSQAAHISSTISHPPQPAAAIATSAPSQRPCTIG